MAIALIGGLIGIVLRSLWQADKELQASNKELQNEHKEMVKKIAEIEVLVAGDYVKRDYFESKVDALFTKVDSIREILDRKADK